MPREIRTQIEGNSETCKMTGGSKSQQGNHVVKLPTGLENLSLNRRVGIKPRWSKGRSPATASEGLACA